MSNSVTDSKNVILVVDDDAPSRLMIRKTLEWGQLEVIEAPSGSEALSRIAERQPDLVLLDIRMPGMDGFETCVEMRKIAGKEQLPIVMVTGLDDTDSIRKAYDAGATDFITKPIPWKILTHRVQYILRSGNLLSDLHRSEARQKAILRAVPDTMLAVKADGLVMEHHRGVRNPAGFLEGPCVGQYLQQLFPEREARVLKRRLAESRTTRHVVDFEIDGPGEATGTVFEVRASQYDADHTLIIFRDVTERKRAEQRIRRLAYYDELTMLPNRQLFRELVKRTIARLSRTDMTLALLYIDLDDFKRINETLGHEIGDRVLKQVSGVLSRTLRGSDAVSRDTSMDSSSLARMGGDEFIIMLSDLNGLDDVERVAERVLGQFSEPVRVGGYELVLSASMGIALHPHHGETVGDLLKSADTAMYHAKSHARSRYVVFSPKMHEFVFDRLHLEQALRRAIENGELRVHYQPQYRGQDLVGLEALARWQHPEQGLLSAGTFVPVAEETGIVVEIGRWVLREVCNQYARWRDEGKKLVRIAVNLSSIQFHDKNLVDEIRGLLESTRMPAEHLELEITESVVMRDSEEAVAMLRRLKELGLRIAIDDFGTGYSSLSYLKQFPVDALKIDQSFVRNLFIDSSNAAITKAIISMARSLDLEVIAEGAETEAQVAFLHANGCREVQGYYFGRPQDAAGVVRLLQGHG